MLNGLSSQKSALFFLDAFQNWSPMSCDDDAWEDVYKLKSYTLGMILGGAGDSW